MTSAVVQENVIQFTVLNSRKNTPKLCKDGTKKNTKNNKVSGVSSEVYAFKSEREINAIVNVLNFKIDNAKTSQKKKDAYRNKLLFLVGMNLGIRASDIRLLKWSFFFDMVNGEYKMKDYYSLKPVKTAKHGTFVKLFFNQAIELALNDYIKIYPIQNIDDYIFQNPSGEPITVSQMWNIIKGTAKEAGIQQNIGTHSLRKTWGYWCWHSAEDKQKALITLQKCFSHKDTATTLKYIGILDTEISDMYNSVCLGF